MSQLNMDSIGGKVAANNPSPVLEAAGVPHHDAHQELAKWRERVPRLVAALRERTDDVARLQAQLAAVRSPGAAVGAFAGPSSVRARDAIIGELESELAALREAHAGLQGELHARAHTVEGLKRDLAGWKAKWHDLAQALDEASALARPSAGHVAEVAALRQALAELESERDNLQARNAQLFETTGLANRQLEALADDLADLRGQLRLLRDALAEVQRERDTLTEDRACLLTEQALARTEVAQLEELLQTLQAVAREGAAADDRFADRIRSLETECAAGADASSRAWARVDAIERERLAAEAARSTAEDAVAAMEQAGAGAASARGEAEAARECAERALAEPRAALLAAGEARACALADAEAARIALAPLEAQCEALAARQRQLEYQLEQRSALVLGLEQEATLRDERLGAVVQARAEAEEALVRANRHAREQSDYIVQLDDRLDRQKELLLGLEEELAKVQENHATALKRQDAILAERDAEARALRLQVAALQGMLDTRDREQTLLTAGENVVRTDRDTRTLTVLNQQLKDARDRNESLLERLRELEERVIAGAGGAPDDDLTRIRGVGPRLAQHLRDLGVTRYGQIAELDPAALDDPHHALAGLKSRILRDGWIEQAGTLGRRPALARPL